MLTARRVAVIVVSIVVYFVTGLGGAAFAVFAGFSFFYPAVIWATIFPFWFGLDGVAGVTFANLLVSLYQGAGVLAFPVTGIQLVVSSLIWLLGPRGASEVRTGRDLASITGVNLLYAFLGYGAFTSVFYFAGFIPLSALLTVIGITVLATGSFVLVVVPLIMRTLTPVVKQNGIYVGNYRERPSARLRGASVLKP